MGYDYQAALQEGFDKQWIDIYETKVNEAELFMGNLRSTSLCSAELSARYNSISTLAHEMGHALHSYFSNKSQTYINSDYSIFCAEVASTTNESYF